MKRNLLNILVCPECHSELNLFVLKETGEQIELGLLQCIKNKELYPIINFIPRMFEESINYFKGIILEYKDFLPNDIYSNLLSYTNYKKLDIRFKHILKSFTSEWNEFGENFRAWGQDEEERKKLLFKCMDIDEVEIQNTRFLDVGCGNGEVLFGLLNTNLEIFSIDLSYSVDKIQNKLSNMKEKYILNIHLIQANAHKLPFKDKVFDFVHSAGVLHHTPDTFQGLKSISRTLKIDGKCFIEVYSIENKNLFEKLIYYLDRFIRKFTVKLPHLVLHILCYIIAPFQLFFLKVLNIFFNNRYLKRTLRETELSLFDNYSPLFQWHHTTYEVTSWFKSLGYKNIKKTFGNSSCIGLVGTKFKR